MATVLFANAVLDRSGFSANSAAVDKINSTSARDKCSVRNKSFIGEFYP
jgi:hypothetical protein